MKPLIISFFLFSAAFASAQGVQYLTPSEKAQTDGTLQTNGAGWSSLYTQGGSLQNNPTSPGVYSQQQFCKDGTCSYIPLEQLPGQWSPAISDIKTFGDYISAAFRIVIILGGMFAVATFVFGGITYMTSEVVGNKDWARKQMVRSVYGILLLLGSYLFLYTINPELTIFDFNPTKLNRSSSTLSNSNQSSNTSQPTEAQKKNCETDLRGRISWTPSGSWICTQ